MKKFLVTLFVTLTLSACAANDPVETTTTLCINDDPYLLYESGEQIFYAEKDRVVKMEIKGLLALDSAAEVDEILDASIELLMPLNELDGVNASIERASETEIFDIVIFDLIKGDLDILIELGLLELESDGEKIDQISLKQSIALMEADGFVCTLVE